MEKIKVSLDHIISEFSLEEIYLPREAKDIFVECNAVNRPGLQITGYFDHFEEERVQIIGHVEHDYLGNMSKEERATRLNEFFAHKPVAVVVSTDLSIYPELMDAAKAYEVPLLRTSSPTTQFLAALIAYLNVALAPRITRHGVLVEVYGEGILILGDSGIGKSECAIELVKRGHRLIADDAVEIKRVSAKALVGSAPEIIRHYVELRGIGIVDVRRIFGMGAVKMTEKIDLIIKLEHWDQNKMYDRFGLDNETTDILGINIPTITIPVRPGRNLAVILEIAAMNNRQKKMGYNTAEEFNKRLMGIYEGKSEER
ncbi:MAG: HPr(Ser) kinase/phosphatase [Ruminococcaceae bacterium]|nr:HPr(Ser) kinase/phosphatase [Oscillospiraceae bacterium]